jgi:TatD DNase family protein
MNAPSDLRPALREFAKHPKVVAIGETGFGPSPFARARNLSSPQADDDARYKEKQAEIFRQQMEVAAEFGLNCIIHQRNAFDDTSRR